VFIHWEINNEIWAVATAQEVEHMPSKHLCFKPQYHQKQKQTKKHLWEAILGADRIIQEVECLPSKREALSTAKRNKWINSWLAHACNPRYLGGWDWEDQGSRLTWTNTFVRPPISKITRAKQTGGVVQAILCLLCKGKKKNPEFKPQCHLINIKRNIKQVKKRKSCHVVQRG
jgi:hypothetical protein